MGGGGLGTKRNAKNVNFWGRLPYVSMINVNLMKVGSRRSDIAASDLEVMETKLKQTNYKWRVSP